MANSIRTGSAVSLVALATMIAGCAAPQSHMASASASRAGSDQDVGLGLRALAALNSRDYPTAISLAERAVARTPGDATIRTLLGNAYFASGRFASAEAAYKDSLSISSDQPQVLLKLALVEIAQGKNAQSIAVLDAGRNMLGAADYGLALALAGRPTDAVAVLESAAREKDADARVRQNLALSYALSGDWVNARTIASQDVPADQLDTRIHQWMQLATPGKPSDQVAALTGISPVAADPGQPAQLALVHGDILPARSAQAAPAPAQAGAVETVVAAAEPVAPVVPPSDPYRVAAAPSFAPAPPSASLAPDFAAFAPKMPAPVFRRAAVRAPVRKAAFRPATGKSPAVVQLGAYGNPQRVAAAWNVAAHRFAALRSFTPVSARFDSPRGTFYRLSVKGFASDHDARLVCESLRRSGGTCFVRNVAGDTPVQIASR